MGVCSSQPKVLADGGGTQQDPPEVKANGASPQEPAVDKQLVPAAKRAPSIDKPPLSPVAKDLDPGNLPVRVIRDGQVGLSGADLYLVSTQLQPVLLNGPLRLLRSWELQPQSLRLETYTSL